MLADCIDFLRELCELLRVLCVCALPFQALHAKVAKNGRKEREEELDLSVHHNIPPHLRILTHRAASARHRQPLSSAALRWQ